MSERPAEAGLSAAALTEVLAVVCGEEIEAPYEAVIALRREPSFAATLYSAWRREGVRLNPALSYELEVYSARIAFYRELQGRLGRLHPGAVPMKGLEVADLYPPGLLRHMNDLDYLADESTLWRVATQLQNEGWQVHTVTFLRVGGDLHLVLSLSLAGDDDWALPRFVEISTVAVLGNMAGVPPRVALPPACRRPLVKNLTMLLYERLEQRYRARDLVDGSLLLQAAAADPGTVETVWRVVDELALWPECMELLALLDAAGLPRPPPPERQSRRRVAARSKRLSAGAARFRRPVDGALRRLQQHMLQDRLGRVERWLWSVAQHRAPVSRTLDAGMVAFGLPLESDGDSAAAGGTTVLSQQRGATWADTPVGRFLLVPGEEVLETAIPAFDDDGGAR